MNAWLNCGVVESGRFDRVTPSHLELARPDARGVRTPKMNTPSNIQKDKKDEKDEQNHIPHLSKFQASLHRQQMLILRLGF